MPTKKKSSKPDWETDLSLVETAVRAAPLESTHSLHTTLDAVERIAARLRGRQHEIALMTVATEALRHELELTQGALSDACRQIAELEAKDETTST